MIVGYKYEIHFDKKGDKIMDKQKNLAIDAKFSELKENEKYSNMIRFVFGNRTFSMNTLKRALPSAPVRSVYLEALLAKFGLIENSTKYKEENLKLGIEELKTLNEVYRFLTVSKIDYLLTKAKELNQLNDRVLNDSSLFRDWEIKIEDLPLSPRIKNALKNKNIFTINNLSDYGFTEKNMLAIRNLGTLSLDELRRVIEPYGLILK